MRDLRFADALSMRLRKEMCELMQEADIYQHSASYKTMHTGLSSSQRVMYARHQTRFITRMLAIIAWLDARKDFVEKRVAYPQETMRQKRRALHFSTQSLDSLAELPEEFAHLIRRSHSLQDRTIHLDTMIGEVWQEK